MIRLATFNLQHRCIQRLLALLLVLLVAISSLTTHAAMEADPVDCATMTQLQHDASDSEEHQCSVCTAVTPRFQLALSAPVEKSAAASVAFVTHSPLPPQRPPRA